MGLVSKFANTNRYQSFANKETGMYDVDLALVGRALKGSYYLDTSTVDHGLSVHRWRRSAPG